METSGCDVGSNGVGSDGTKEGGGGGGQLGSPPRLSPCGGADGEAGGSGVGGKIGGGGGGTWGVGFGLFEVFGSFGLSIGQNI